MKNPICNHCDADLRVTPHYDGCPFGVQPASTSTQQEKHTTFATGAKRCEAVAGEHQGVPLRYDLLFSNTEFLRRMAATYGEGAVKYGDDNWRNGMPEKSIMNHALAHLVQHLEGDYTEDHLAHATWNLITLMWVQVNKPELMDLTALAAKGKLQPCNKMGTPQKMGTPSKHQTPDQGEGGVAQFTMHNEPELNQEWRRIQLRMASAIDSNGVVQTMSEKESHVLSMAAQGLRLNEDEYRTLVSSYIKYGR